VNDAQHSAIVSFIWGIADDVLRDLYVRGKYRDVILPMTVLRRLDAVLEVTKQAVLDMKAALDKAGVTNQEMALRHAAGQPYRRGAQRLVALYRRCGPGREQHPPLAHRERLAGGHRRSAPEHVAGLIDSTAAILGPGPHAGYSAFLGAIEPLAEEAGVKLTSKRLRLLQTALAQRDEAAAPVIRKMHRPGKGEPDPLHGRFEATVEGRRCIVEYEPDPELRDTEQVPLLEEGGVEGFFRREVLPHVPDAWVDDAATRIGYDISFTRYFYKPQPLRTLEEIRADILALERETEGLLQSILQGGQQSG
jgi:hypothetical protein